MLREDFAAARQRAHIEQLDDEALYFGEIEGFPGVWATGPTPPACRDEPVEVIEEWVLFRLSGHLPLPVVEGIAPSIHEVA